jgi:WD40 repeat protein
LQANNIRAAFELALERHVAIARPQRVKRRDLSEAPLHPLPKHCQKVSLVARKTPYSDRLAAGSARAGVALYHLRDGQVVDTLFPESVIWDMAFTSDGQYGILALAQTIVVWRVADKTIVRSWQADGGIVSLAVSADSQYPATGTDGEMRLAQIWRLADQQLLATYAIRHSS